MAEKTKLVGQNYTTPDLVAKVTGKAKYAEDFRADGMLFAKLLLSPLPHARVKRIDASAALAMPGVKAILTVDDLPSAVAGASVRFWNYSFFDYRWNCFRQWRFRVPSRPISRWANVNFH